VADLLTWMTLFGLGLIVGGIALLVTAIIATGRLRRRRRRLAPRAPAPRAPAPAKRPLPPPYPRPDVRRSALLAETVQLDQVAPAWATPVTGVTVPPAPPQAGSRDPAVESTVDALAPIKSPTVQRIAVPPVPLARPYVDTRPRNRPQRTYPDPPNRQAPQPAEPPASPDRTGRAEAAARNRGRIHGRDANPSRNTAFRPPQDSGVRRHRPGY
jgi:hypothetical protein